MNGVFGVKSKLINMLEVLCIWIRSRQVPICPFAPALLIMYTFIVIAPELLVNKLVKPLVVVCCWFK